VLGGAAFIVIGLGVLAIAGLVGSKGSGFIATMFNNNAQFWMRRGLYGDNRWQSMESGGKRSSFSRCAW
jgi:hypothetical protein